MAIVVWLVLLEGLYLHALRVLRGRGVAVPRWQVAAWHAAMALSIAGLLSPIDDLGDDGLSFHMLQHLLIADLAAPLMLVGLRNPVLAFFLPRPVLVPLARTHWLRGGFRFLRKPLVALPVYVLVLYSWHFSIFFNAAVRHPLVHARWLRCLRNGGAAPRPRQLGTTRNTRRRSHIHKDRLRHSRPSRCWRPSPILHEGRGGGRWSGRVRR